MRDRLTSGLLLLQQHAYAAILCEFHRIAQVRDGAILSSPAHAQACRRLKESEQRVAAWLAAVRESELFAAVRVARALHLRMLLKSASARLDAWRETDGFKGAALKEADMARMPPSHAFERIAHAFECNELVDLEESMTPLEAALYVRSLERAEG